MNQCLKGSWWQCCDMGRPSKKKPRPRKLCGRTRSPAHRVLLHPPAAFILSPRYTPEQEAGLLETQFIFLVFYLFICLCQVLVAACRIFSCSMWILLKIFIWLHQVCTSCSMQTLSCEIQDLSSLTGDWTLAPPALGTLNLSHWTIREVPTFEP